MNDRPLGYPYGFDDKTGGPPTWRHTMPVADPFLKRSSHDFRVNDKGTLTHKRWLNPDGSFKTGEALEREELLVDMEELAQRLLAYIKRVQG